MKFHNIQILVLAALEDAGFIGVTSAELGVMFGADFGVTSSALSKLDKAGKCVRLAEKRDGRAIYVLPDCTEGRETVVYGARKLTERAQEGFRRGYELGLSEGVLEAQNKSYWDGYNNGWSVGVEDLARRMDRCLEEMLRAIRRVHGIAPFRPGGRSWMIQPQHTVETMRRFVQTSTSRTKASRKDGVVDLSEQRVAR